MNCYLCNYEVSWGTPVCPQCGAALEWIEGDDEDHLASLMPVDWDDEVTFRQQRKRLYAIGLTVAGVLMAGIGLLAGRPLWMVTLVGVLFLVTGVYSLFRRR